VIKTRCKYFT